MTLAFAPFNYWYLAFFILPITFYLLAYQCTKVFWPAWVFGLAYFGVGLSWVHVSIEQFGGLPLAASLGLMFLLCGYLALFPAILFSLLKKYIKLSMWPLALPLAWFLMEWLRARVLTGFPWLSLGYSQSNSIFSSFYPLIGEVGLSILMVLVSISLACGIKQKKYFLAATPLLVCLLVSIVLASVHWTVPTGESKKVALVQGNIKQSIKWDPLEADRQMLKYKEMSKDYWQHDLIIWPEAAIPMFESASQAYLLELETTATKYSTGLISGIINYDIYTGIGYNSLIALGRDHDSNRIPYYKNHSNRYSKHHLLPIGEFVPFESLLRTLAPIFNLPNSSFTRGAYVQDNLVSGGITLAPAICFEIAFPRQLSANINSSTQAILTVSNDAWFGDSHGPHQHLQIAQVRAKEFGLPVFRATNNGVTALIDHQGNINARLPQFSDSVLSRNVNLVSGTTYYTRFSDWPIFILSVLFFAIAIYQQYFSKPLNNNHT